MINNEPSYPPILHLVETTFSELVETELQDFKAVIKTIDTLIHGSGIEIFQFEPEVILTFIEPYLSHEHWKFRNLALIFLFFVKEPSKPPLQDRFWQMFADPDLRVCNVFIQLLNTEGSGWHWFDYKKLTTFRSLPITQDTLQSFDVSSLFRQLPLMKGNTQVGYFWGIVCITINQLRLGNCEPLKSHVLQLIEFGIQTSREIRTSTYYETHLSEFWVRRLPL